MWECNTATDREGSYSFFTATFIIRGFSDKHMRYAIFLNITRIKFAVHCNSGLEDVPYEDDLILRVQSHYKNSKKRHSSSETIKRNAFSISTRLVLLFPVVLFTTHTFSRVFMELWKLKDMSNSASVSQNLPEHMIQEEKDGDSQITLVKPVSTLPLSYFYFQLIYSYSRMNLAVLSL